MAEVIELILIGDNDKSQVIRNNELLNSDPDAGWENFAIVRSKQLNMFTRNKYDI